ncbi:hypothetical protein VTO42DRAFT_2032 [Malbranchea cinnamomea]
MDIRDLLSSNDPPSRSSSNQSSSTQRSRQPQRPNSSMQHSARSPFAHTTPNESRSHVLSPTTGPAISVCGGIGTPPSTDIGPTRPSTNPLDNLAEVASIQQQQQQQPQPRSTAPSSNPGIIRHESYDQQGVIAAVDPRVRSVSRNTPTSRLSFDVAMSEPPRESIRSDYSGTCLNPEAQRMATQLAAEIQQSQHAYEARVKFIRLLHQGFVDHVYPPSSPESRGDPHQYDVLKDLRAAREELDRLFAIGEDLWAEWIQDESLLARTVEERISVIELCQRAVEEEYGSTKLWTIYGDWMLYLYNAANSPQTGGRDSPSQGHWSEEDKMIGRETFTWESVMEVWRNGAEATRWHINDGHVVWNRYLELALREVSSSPSPENVSRLKALFENRLQTPHMAWDQTFQMFSNFISTYYNVDYEAIMVDTNNKAADAKATCNAREARELALQRAADAGDTAAEWTAFTEYIEWEANPKKRFYNYNLSAALYQRAVLRFPTDVNLWEDYVMFVIDQSFHDRMNISVVPLMERATRHCPWSGSLWSQHLLSAEREGYSFTEISNIKHKATRTGLLEAAGVDEVLKFHTTWCSYLRRHAFQADATDEDLDVAQVGIRSAIESVQELGEKDKKNVPMDPMFRLERIYIRYLSESGSWDSAREEFKALIRRHGHSYEFWLMYYNWELISWVKFTQTDGSASAARRTPSPSYATAVLKQALRRTDLDWPEKIMDTYIAHCEQYEDVEELQLAVVEIRKAMKAVAKRRAKQALHNAENLSLSSYVAPAATATRDEDTQMAGYTGDSQRAKRKREEEADVNGLVSKKHRGGALETKEHPEETQQPRRDRENALVMVKNLPQDVTTLRIRQFFRDCGKINNLKILPSEGSSTSAIVEFESKDDALAAQTRDQKSFDGKTISVQLESQSTLFITNFPPTADETYIRDMFSPYGEIIEVRFPSLKYNTHRRFCYVQFASSASAYAATELDNKIVADNYRLVAKISDPSKRQERSGPVEEGREIHISNLDWKATEEDLVELFTAYGHVEAARIPTKANGGSKGFAFVVFSTKEAATAALEMDKKTFRNRELHVRLSTTRTGAKRTSTTVISRVDRPHSPVSTDRNGNRQSTPTSAVSNDSYKPSGERRQRTLGLMNIPDTVNDARVRALVEPFGPLIKIILRPDHQGAIVEYRDVNDAGRAALELEGKEIVPGRHIRVGNVEEMLRQPPERKTDKLQVGKGKENPPGDGIGQDKTAKEPRVRMPVGPIKRPPQPGVGRRGGLGVKRGGLGAGSRPIPTAGAGVEDGMAKTQPKSNSDFRAMLEQSRSKPEERPEKAS